ncbi:MAG: YcgN family cysteine cluster protein [Halothiobacillaceae bacterium]
MNRDRTPWWHAIPLKQMTPDQWESLCDGCAKCCLQKIEDEEGTVYYTELACALLDTERCRCGDYHNRHERVPGCVWLRPEDLDEFYWLPPTCAYRLVAEGRPLPDWHHLVCGDHERIHRVGASVAGRCRSHSGVPEECWDEHVIDWPLESP